MQWKINEEPQSYSCGFGFEAVKKLHKFQEFDNLLACQQRD